MTWSQTHPLKLKSKANESRHFFTRSRIAAKERQLGFLLVASNSPPPLPVVVTLTRIASRPFDSDNVTHAFKNIRDGIADAYGVNDKDVRFDGAAVPIVWRYSQERGTPAIRITIEAQS